MHPVKTSIPACMPQTLYRCVVMCAISLIDPSGGLGLAAVELILPYLSDLLELSFSRTHELEARALLCAPCLTHSRDVFDICIGARDAFGNFIGAHDAFDNYIGARAYRQMHWDRRSRARRATPPSNRSEC